MKTIEIKRNAVPYEFADRKNAVTGDYNYRIFNPKTGELYTDLGEYRIIGGYYNVIVIDGLAYLIMYSAFYSSQQLCDIKEEITKMLN